MTGEDIAPGERDRGDEEEARREGKCSIVKGGGPSSVGSDGRVIGEEAGFDRAESGATGGGRRAQTSISSINISSPFDRPS